jgi:hypothetical protein
LYIKQFESKIVVMLCIKFLPSKYMYYLLKKIFQFWYNLYSGWETYWIHLVFICVGILKRNLTIGC